MRSILQIPFVLIVATTATLVACSDSATTGGEDTAGVDGGGDINTDLFNPVDGGSDASDDPSGGDDTGGEDTGGGGDDTGGEQLGRYEPCGLGGPQCAPPLTCVGNCQLPCSAGCPDGEECIDLGGFGAGGVCGVRGGEDDDCDLTIGLFCEEELFCDEGACTAPEIGGEGADCGGFGEQCEEGLTCITTGLGEGICQRTCEEDAECGEGNDCVPSIAGGSACFEDCEDPDTDECADSDQFECRAPIGGSDPACLPRFGDPPGEGAFGDSCSGGSDCAEGLFCPGLAGSYCTQTCGSAGECPTEPEGAECVSLGIGGVCSFTCPGGADEECPEGMTCTDLFGQSVCSW